MMICPACGNKHFSPVQLEGGLPGERCKDCSGVWVELERYRIWRSKMPAVAALEFPGDIGLSDGAVRVCATTGRLMARINVSRDPVLRLDFSPMADAVWLDRGEWEALVALGLHDQLDAIVSERWQRELKEAASRERMEANLRARFGDADYEELLRMRAWLQGQPKRADMVAFLNAKAD
ncbi:MAG: zf-TFIIB domain-containing protein [Pseudomonadota bacterium]